MFSKAFRKASNKVEGAVETAAVEAAFGLVAILLGCGAYIFAAIAVAWWLSTVMAVYFALLIVAAITAICALFIYFLGIHGGSSSTPEPAEEVETGGSPLSLLFTNMGYARHPAGHCCERPFHSATAAFAGFNNSSNSRARRSCRTTC